MERERERVAMVVGMGIDSASLVRTEGSRTCQL